MPILQKQYINQLQTHFLTYAEKRRHVISKSADALHLAKRAIFCLHRDDKKGAKKKINDAEKIFVSLFKKYKADKRTLFEGSLRAALEEYVEAVLFFNFLTNKKLGKITRIAVEPETYIAGLCDVPGELLRYGIKAATNKDFETAQECAKVAQEIIGQLIEFNLTKYLRTKFDQAKFAVQKLEHVVYELSLRFDK